MNEKERIQEAYERSVLGIREKEETKLPFGGVKPLHAVIQKSIPNFKKEYPEFYKILREVFSEKEMLAVAHRKVMDAINNMSQEVALKMQKMSPKEIEKQIFYVVNAELAGDMATKALKIKNKWLKNKIDLLKR